eukprot:jgi/Undpi1/13465/HiC_scaffold_8.g03124.m1
MNNPNTTARRLPLAKSTSVWLYSVSADKAGSFDKAEALEDVNSRLVSARFFLGMLAGASQFAAKLASTPLGMRRTSMGLRTLSVAATVAVATAFWSPAGVVRTSWTCASPRTSHHASSTSPMSSRAWGSVLPSSSSPARTARLSSLHMLYLCHLASQCAPPPCREGQSGSPQDTPRPPPAPASSSSSSSNREVYKRVKQVAQPAFFLRLAELVESEKDDQQRAALERLATEVPQVLEKLVRFTEDKVGDSSSLLEIIITSAAEKNGEFLMPLSADRHAALRQSVKIHRDQLDEIFLATVQTWMEKSAKDEGMEGLVILLQKLLQVYASNEILERQQGGSAATAEAEGEGFGESAKRTPSRRLLDQILETDADQWDGILQGLSTPGQGMTGGVTKDALLGAIQTVVETVILQQENGSIVQRVQAEFLSELCRRIEVACPERPLGPGMLE